jgi:hypothetical protein
MADQHADYHSHGSFLGCRDHILGKLEQAMSERGDLTGSLAWIDREREAMAEGADEPSDARVRLAPGSGCDR